MVSVEVEISFRIITIICHIDIGIYLTQAGVKFSTYLQYLTYLVTYLLIIYYQKYVFYAQQFSKYSPYYTYTIVCTAYIFH